MKFSGKVGSGPMNRLLNFGGNLDHGYQSLAEVCAVPGLLVF